MFGIFLALGSTLFSGICEALAKQMMVHGSRHKAIVYTYVALVALLVIGAFALGLPFAFPPELLPAYIVQSAVGAAAIAALFKAFESGKVSVLAPLSALYILVVLATGILVFGEAVGTLQLAGTAIILASAFVLAFEDIHSFRLEKGVLCLLLTILGWGYYYSAIRIFVDAMGPYMASVFLEGGVALFVISYYAVRKKDLSLPSREQSVVLAKRSVLVFAATLLYAYAVADIGVALTSIIAAGAPLVSVPSSYLLLGEKMSAYKYAAALLIVLGLVFVLFP